ncbi:MAG: hypothetical protein IJX28_08300 [Clostridia bacterium]|nr:hypothetical protein [Clostridia bacterium]
MKKLLAFVLLCVFMFSAFACGTSTNLNETTTSFSTEEIITNPTQPEETTTDPMVILNELTEIPSIVVELGEKRQDLFGSLVCAHVNGGAVADGILILQSTEKVLGRWVSEGKIPTITLDEKSELVNEESNTVLTDPITFYLYREVNGSYSEIVSLDNATITDVYTYGIENLKGASVYIRFDISKTTDRGDARYAYIMHVEFGDSE